MTQLDATIPLEARLRASLSRRPAAPEAASFVPPSGFKRAENLKSRAGEAQGEPPPLDLARLKAAGLEHELLAGLLASAAEDGEFSEALLTEASPPANLARRADLEALIGSGRFGNLLGSLASPAAGRVFNARDLSSWRQKNGSISLARPEGGAEKANLLNSFGLLRPPQRRGVSPQPKADQPGPEQAAPEQAASERPVAGGPESGQPQAWPATEGLTAAGTGGEAAAFSPERLDRLVNKVALALNMDPHLIKAVIKTESNFDPQAVSKVGAKGLMQLMPATAKELGVQNPFDPVENVWAGARYLKKMLDRHAGNIKSALASYNWGPGNFDRHGGLRLPGETQRYISSVTRHYARFKGGADARA